jgi:hypothetical protein
MSGRGGGTYPRPVPTISAFWGDRSASRDEAAVNLSQFLSRLGSMDSRLTDWRPKGRSRRGAEGQAVLPLGPDVLVGHLREQRTDFGVVPMPELGFSFAAWNGGVAGEDAAVSCTVGLHAQNPHLRNSVVLQAPDDLARPPALDALITAMVEV